MLIFSVYHGIGVFNFSNENQCFALQYCLKTYSIKCHISVHKQEVNNAYLRTERLELLNVLINLVHARCISNAQKPMAYVKCPLQHNEKCGPHLSLDKIKPKMYCTKVFPKEEVPVKAYNLLLTFNYPGECDENCTKVACAIVLCPISESKLLTLYIPA